MRIVHVVIFRKEFRTVGDALQAEARAAILRWTFEKIADGRGNPFLCT